MFSLFRGREKLFLACDIGGTRVKLVAFRASRQSREAALVDYFEKEFSREEAHDSETYLRKAVQLLSEFSEKIREKENEYPRAALISIPHGMTVSRHIEFRTVRPNPGSTLTAHELGEVWQRSKERATVIPEELQLGVEGWNLLTFELERITLDGYTLLHEDGDWHGRELEFSVISTFWREGLHEIVGETSKYTAFRPIFVPRLFLIRDYFRFAEGRGASGVLCDMSAEDCTLFVFHGGELSAFASFPFGGGDVTRAVAKSMYIRERDAEVLKRQWSAGRVAVGTAKKIERAVLPLFDFWKREWSMFLQNASEHAVIRPHFYLSGGGSILPTFPVALSQAAWYENFATSEHATVSRLSESATSQTLLSNWPVHSMGDTVIFALILRMIQKYL
ncbi:MAG: cell division FtsA domain-containing protein [Candidatus Sungbacteria bacterium]|nr:cell division FtsA domain-containing protein [Candidatus Sungbacteria bacterium]